MLALIFALVPLSLCCNISFLFCFSAVSFSLSFFYLIFSLYGSIFYFFVFLPPSYFIFVPVDVKFVAGLMCSSAEGPWLVFTVTTQG